MRDLMIYQVRVESGESPENMLTALTHSVWTALQQLESLRVPDPHRWPELYGDFSTVFKRRLQFFADCGTLPECRYSIGVYGGAPSAGSTFILALRGGLVDFVRGLSSLVLRRLRREPGRKKSLNVGVRERVEGALHRALTPYLYFNNGCAHCPAREKAPERRIWKEGKDAPVEGLIERRKGAASWIP